LQPPAKMKHGLMLAREKRVHAHSRFGGNFLEADPLEFVREENFALLFREFVYSGLEFLQQNVSRVGGFRPRIG